MGRGEQACVTILDGDGPDIVEIFDERAGIASGSVPPLYVDASARLNCQRPTRFSEAEWRLALDDGGWFLDAWGTTRPNCNGGRPTYSKSHTSAGHEG